MTEDQEIAKLYSDGKSSEAFEKIVHTYSERLYWHVRSFGCSHEDSDDLLQEIFIKVWNALPSYRGEAQLFTWLWRIATNETLNFLRSRRFRFSLSSRSIGVQDENRSDDDPWFDGDEAQRLLSKALRKLPPKQRAVFSLRYYQDLSYEQISEILGVTVGALKASYHHAYMKIRAELEGAMG